MTGALWVYGGVHSGGVHRQGAQRARTRNGAHCRRLLRMKALIFASLSCSKRCTVLPRKDLASGSTCAAGWERGRKRKNAGRMSIGSAIGE